MSFVIQSIPQSFNPYVSLVPITAKIYNEPNTIFYDPFKTIDIVTPNYGYYFSYPDLNTDVNVQRKILMNVWDKLESDWIFNYIKVFNYIKKSGSSSSYRLVDSLEEGEIKASTVDLEAKADWLLSKYYKKSDLASTIEKFRSKANLNWWDVNTNANIDRLKDFIYNQIRRKIMKDLS